MRELHELPHVKIIANRLASDVFLLETKAKNEDLPIMNHCKLISTTTTTPV